MDIWLLEIFMLLLLPFHQKNTETILNRNRQGIVLPEVEHEVEPLESVEFFVEFWKKVWV